jgi:hypothetical protein
MAESHELRCRKYKQQIETLKLDLQDAGKIIAELTVIIVKRDATIKYITTK